MLREGNGFSFLKAGSKANPDLHINHVPVLHKLLGYTTAIGKIM